MPLPAAPHPARRRACTVSPPLRRGSWLALLFAWLGFAAAGLRADYPIAGHRYLADPAALVHQGRVYLYCSNDDENAVEGGYTMKSLVCVSSADLKNWTDHGVVFRVPADAAWASHAWAPAVIARHGQFYLYFGNNASGIGVAVSTSPTGPFVDAKGSALITSATPGVLPATNLWVFDPAVFIDDDEQAYLYFGGNGIAHARVIKLNADMVSVSGAAVTIETPNFFEASWLHKRDGVYYFSYSANPASGLTIDYLTSAHPMSGFTHRGTVAGQPPSNNNNNHHAIFALQGSWYHAYHNRAVATAAGLPTTYRRNLGVERLEHRADGTIAPVAYTTDGLAALAPLDPYARVEAETFSAQSGVETEPCSAGGMNVRFAADGSWLKLTGVDFGAGGAARFTAALASASTGGSLELRLDRPDGALLGTCTITGPGGEQTWTTASCAIAGATGVQDVYLKFLAGGSAGLNVDHWRFDPAQPLIRVQPLDKVVFVGGTLHLTVAAEGVEPAIQWSRDGVPLAGQTQSTLKLEPVTPADSGSYTARIVTAGGTATTRAATVHVTPDAARLANLSCLIQLRAGQFVIPGFVIAGTGTKQVLLRAAGPALASLGVTGVMADPQFRVFRGSTEIARSDNWAAELRPEFARLGAFAFAESSRDAALLVTLDAGQPHTVHLSGVGDSAGIVLLEVYDAELTSQTSRLVNLAVRGPVGVDGASLVVGFVLVGTGQRQLLLRGAGPALEPMGVTGALTDPRVALYDRHGQLLQTNTGWTHEQPAGALESTAALVGAFPLATGSRDSATLATLVPTLYTLHVSSSGGTTGEALAEVYEVP